MVGQYNYIKVIGPRYGYYPKAAKTILILKDLAYLPNARCLFEKEGIKVTCDGERHLGAVIGSSSSFLKKSMLQVKFQNG